MRARMRSRSPIARSCEWSGAKARARAKRADRMETLAQQPALADRAAEPAPQRARAHAGDGGVEHRQQRRRFIAAQAGVEFEVAPRRRVERERVARFLDMQRADVRQRGALRVAHVLEQRAGRADRKRQFIGAEAAQVERSELVGQRARGGWPARNATARARA